MIGEFLLESFENNQQEGNYDLSTVAVDVHGGGTNNSNQVLDDAARAFRVKHSGVVQRLLLGEEQQPQSSTSTQKHIPKIMVYGPSKSGKSSLLLDWAITMARHGSNKSICCSQCQSHPETCRCNNVDLILCQSSNFDKSTSTSTDQNASDAVEVSEEFPNVPKEGLLSRCELLALQRIRVHYVYSRRQFLTLLLKIQGRPISEQPRYGILVDNLDRFAIDLPDPQLSNTPNFRNSHHHQQQSSQHQNMVLSQLVALLVDTTQEMTRIQKKKKI
mmetsp:Transcript_3054/g.4116  ORF Transcript_3054/g.4116 Transcript_3054/m.4116 type:complete len:274 (+) Transcript_3054:122-943(+)